MALTSDILTFGESGWPAWAVNEAQIGARITWEILRTLGLWLDWGATRKQFKYEPVSRS
jgi:hypothetical protein